MTTTNAIVLKFMNFIFWAVFIGLCIETGAMLTSFIVSLFSGPGPDKYLYYKLNLSELYSYDFVYYIIVVSLLVLISGMKAFIAYLIVRVFMKFDLTKPFNSKLTDLFKMISYTAIGAGIMASLASGQCKWLMKKGIPISIDWGESEILFFAGVIYIIALIFEKGTELQTENDLTV